MGHFGIRRKPVPHIGAELPEERIQLLQHVQEHSADKPGMISCPNKAISRIRQMRQHLVEPFLVARQDFVVAYIDVPGFRQEDTSGNVILMAPLQFRAEKRPEISKMQKIMIQEPRFRSFLRVWMSQEKNALHHEESIRNIRAYLFRSRRVLRPHVVLLVFCSLTVH
jgi:hypothetical protein